MPSVEPSGGNFTGSVTHRPKPSTFGPWLPGHWYQKSSRLTYWYPTPARPLLLIASACAFILPAVGVRRTKLQLLHPNGGVRARRLSCARATGAPDTTATAMRGAATSAAIRILVNLRMASPRIPERGAAPIVAAAAAITGGASRRLHRMSHRSLGVPDRHVKICRAVIAGIGSVVGSRAVVSGVDA